MLSRRHLLAGAAFTCSGTLASSGWASFVDGDDKINWTKTADVIVVGYGGAGGFAAIEAHDCGSSVLVLEKTAAGGGNSELGGGGCTIPKNSDDAYEFYTSMCEMSRDDYDPELIRVLCDEVVKLKDYIPSLAKEFKLYKYRTARYVKLPHADTIEKFGFTDGKVRGGPGLWKIIDSSIKKRHIEVIYNSPVNKLIVSKGSVIGVSTQTAKGVNHYRAKKAVVLTTGGFENDPEMLRNYAQGTDILNLGTPANTGDGVRMAMSVGAKLWHMTAYSCPLGVKVPHKNCVSTLGIPKAGIWVGKDGKRFADEKGVDLHAGLYMVNNFDTATYDFPRIPCFLIFDRKSLDSGDFAFRVVEGGRSVSFGWAGRREGFTFSPDGREELELGIIRKYPDVRSLAKAEGINPDNLEETIKRWNNDVRNGSDKDFNRRIKDKNGKIISAPLEGNELCVMTQYPALLNTQGGPRHNSKAQVISVDGSVIPHLYAAGELGSMWGCVYEGGNNIAECIVFGRIAGRNAAKETPI